MLVQIWAIHSKAIRKLADCFDSICEDAIRRQIEGEKSANNKVGGTPGAEEELLRPLDVSLAEELDVAAKEIKERQKRDRETLMSQLGGELSKYEITADQKDLEEVGILVKFSRLFLYFLCLGFRQCQHEVLQVDRQREKQEVRDF